MKKITPRHKQALAEAKRRHQADPNVISIGIGLKRKDGKVTGEIGVVIGVRKKIEIKKLSAHDMVLETYSGITSDVEEYGDIIAYEYTKHIRPVPPGYSIGHLDITAGTLGAWVKTLGDDAWHILSNNHVIANSNDARLTDRIVQPGPADGSGDPIAKLTKFARIQFDNDTDEKKKVSQALWKLWKWPANYLAQMSGCKYRLQVTVPNSVDQPYPNLIDAAIAKVDSESLVELNAPVYGEVNGFEDFDLAAEVHKSGRTTGYTQGVVEVIGTSIKVDYGPGKGPATFVDQIIIRGDEGNFSAPGDSGSAILTRDNNFIGGLLFAGGGGITVANKISNVISILGVKL